MERSKQLSSCSGRIYFHTPSYEEISYDLLQYQDSGPTNVGDSESDSELMAYLGAVKITEPGKN
ncbi:hypothetical protein SK128_023773 [Halocaridina rubra]|uniref:Uncharacterized protein n=1 Tax=Halocaridina rubra TaxID=373956 RepID=A0AAN9ADC4_HALRR